MQIDFYINFTKRQNSTKRPVEGGIVTKHTLTGYLKEPCSVMKPVINIQNVPIQNAPCVMTYAYIPSFYRYYFVKEKNVVRVEFYSRLLKKIATKVFDTFEDAQVFASSVNGIIYC